MRGGQLKVSCSDSSDTPLQGCMEGEDSDPVRRTWLWLCGTPDILQRLSVLSGLEHLSSSSIPLPSSFFPLHLPFSSPPSSPLPTIVHLFCGFLSLCLTLFSAPQSIFLSSHPLSPLYCSISISSCLVLSPLFCCSLLPYRIY